MPALPWTRIRDPRPEQEYVVMASRLPLASFRYLPAFFRATQHIRKQLSTASGLVGYSLDAHLATKTFWTLSAWESREALNAFSRADPHNTDVTIIRPHMRPTTFVFWTVRGTEVPVRWDEARRRVTATMTS